MTNTNRQNGGERDLAAYEKDLAGYLQERIKPGLSRSAIPLLARSIAKDIARSEPPAASDPEEPQADADAQSDAEQADLEADEQSDAQGDEEQADLEADEQSDAQGDEEQSDFEANMHELQADLGEEWIVRFSVHGDDGWLTAEAEDGSQRVEAPDAQRLVTIVDAIDECGGRQP
jgi:hypothetical protein